MTLIYSFRGVHLSAINYKSQNIKKNAQKMKCYLYILEHELDIRIFTYF